MDNILESLYNKWFSNPSIWFGCEKQIDQEITNEYDKYIETSYNLEEIISNKNQSIGLIILYDQIIRHINRIFNNKYSIQIYNEKAIEISKQVFLIYSNSLNPDEFAFVMLPYRHSKVSENIFMVLQETWKQIENNSKAKDLLQSSDEEIIYHQTKIIENNEIKYKRFLKATYEKYIEQVDDSSNLVLYDIIQDKITLDINEYLDVLDNKCIDFMQNKILSFDYIKLKDELSNNFISNFETIKQIQNIFPLVLSISGGVDSMITSYILANNKIPFVCVHINYFNRAESMKEEQFVISWCKMLKVPLYVRRIEEINRPKCMKYGLRELYENYTRDIRYQSYINGVNSIPNVILGHNQDDCFENIITNVANKSKYENLYGMENVTEISYKQTSINFLRPMLTISKAQIYQFAIKYDIPYLFDSTPKWSQRGKIRDIVRPILHEFNNNLVDGIFELQSILKESLEMVDILSNSWYEKIIENPNKKSIDKKLDIIKTSQKQIYQVFSIEIIPEKIITSKIFWKNLFVKLNIKVSSKSLNEYTYKLIKIKNNIILMELNKLEKYQINSNQQIKFLKNKSNNLIIEFD